MGIRKYNVEGRCSPVGSVERRPNRQVRHRDPTTYEALSNIRKGEKAAKRAYRPFVYICSPFAGDTEGNAEKARRYSRFAVKNGAIPFAPHLLFPQFLDDGKPAERAIGMFMGMVFLGKCEQMWVFGGVISAGMAAEIEKAEKRNMPVRYFTENCEEVGLS